MKKQSGFTLIELMVVMAIIAILATAGLSAYTGYLKKARDNVRIQRLATINNIVLGMVSTTGTTPLTALEVYNAVKDANNNTELLDPMDGKDVCAIGSGTANKRCAFTYRICDGGSATPYAPTGYAVGTRFESVANRQLMIDDVVASSGTASYTDADIYELGSCNTVCTSPDTATSCGTGTTDPVLPWKIIASPAVLDA